MRPNAFSNPGKFFRGNIHTHSNLSDGALSAAEVCRRYQNEGYDFLSLTEHFLGQYDYPIADTTPFQTENFMTILGAELHSGAMENGELWHILAVGLPKDFKPSNSPEFYPIIDQETGPQIAQRAVEAGAFVTIAHPEWSVMSEADAASITSAHAVEVYNHGSEVECDRGRGLHTADLLLSSGRKLSFIATDDAHFRTGNLDAFGGWVMVKAEENTPELILDALKTGANYSTLSVSQKIAVDKMIMKKRPAIANIAKRLFPGVRKKEMARLQQLRKGPKNEENVVEATQTTQDKDISKRGGTQPAKYHKGLSKDTKAKRDAQFKKQAAMSDDNPNAYKPAPGDASATTKPSKYTKAYKDMYGENVTRADVKAINVKEPDGKIVIRKTKKDVQVEGESLAKAKAAIKREKDADKEKHDRMRDAARTADTRSKNRQTEEVHEMAKRGRPKKTGETGIENIQMQLRKVVSLNGQKPVEFENGKKMKMTQSQARTIDKKIGDLRMPKDKQQFVNFINQSPENMKKALDPKFKKPEQFKSYLMNAKESLEKRQEVFEQTETPTRRRFRNFSEEKLLEKSMAGLQKKAEKSGISYGTLKKVYDRGVAAWRTGHRPGTTPSQWGYARVNAFITKKKKGGLNHDKDLA